jgi:hypothetical protein
MCGTLPLIQQLWCLCPDVGVACRAQRRIGQFTGVLVPRILCLWKGVPQLKRVVDERAPRRVGHGHAPDPLTRPSDLDQILQPDTPAVRIREPVGAGANISIAWSQPRARVVGAAEDDHIHAGQVRLQLTDGDVVKCVEAPLVRKLQDRDPFVLLQNGHLLERPAFHQSPFIISM